jgi:hypothetical protein
VLERLHFQTDLELHQRVAFGMIVFRIGFAVLAQVKVRAIGMSALVADAQNALIAVCIRGSGQRVGLRGRSGKEQTHGHIGRSDGIPCIGLCLEYNHPPDESPPYGDPDGPDQYQQSISNSNPTDQESQDQSSRSYKLQR